MKSQQPSQASSTKGTTDAVRDYERALAEFNARLEAARRNYWWGGG
jgi:hypothetical protein